MLTRERNDQFTKCRVVAKMEAYDETQGESNVSHKMLVRVLNEVGLQSLKDMTIGDRLLWVRDDSFSNEVELSVGRV